MSELMLDSAPELSEKIARAAGVRLSDCYQCGKCSAGCPMAHAMDIMPRQAVRCLQLGEADVLLRSKTIWLCASCHACAERCPNGIDLPSLLEYARYEAKRQRLCAVREVGVFNDLFIENIRLFGKSQEALLEGAYNLTTGRLTQDLKSAPHMLRRGIVQPEVHAVADRAGVRAMIKRAQTEDEKC